MCIFILQKSFDSLTHLDLFNNDICNLDDFRSKVFKLLPSLKYLDDADADENEEDDSDGEQNGELSDEEDEGTAILQIQGDFYAEFQKYYQLFINHLNFLSYFAIKMKTRAVKKKAKMAMMALDQQQFTMIILKMGKMTILTRKKLERRRTMTRLTKKMVSKRFYTYSVKSLDPN